MIYALVVSIVINFLLVVVIAALFAGITGRDWQILELEKQSDKHLSQNLHLVNQIREHGLEVERVYQDSICIKVKGADEIK